MGKRHHIHKFITDLHNQLHYNELFNQSYLPKAAKHSWIQHMKCLHRC